MVALKRLVTAVTVVAGIVTSGWVVLAPPSPVGTTDSAPNWSVSSEYLAQPSALSIACPSASECIEVGRGIMATYDAGNTWVPLLVPGGTIPRHHMHVYRRLHRCRRNAEW